MQLFDSLENVQGHPMTKGDVVIGNDVWIGRGAFIGSGVHIGDGAVIGAQAVVMKDVPPYSITAGNPARHIKYRFDEATICKLLEIRWWDWTDEDIERAGKLLLNNEVNELHAFACIDLDNK
jgi:carbonic anhydrase/acetyltransferase-like protein (isoleucine patch superfamily)